MQRSLGWLPDVPSVRDYTEGKPEVSGSIPAMVLAAPSLPSQSLKASEFMPPVEDQFDVGACVANAIVTLAEQHERRFTGKYVDRSRLFLYKAGRNMLGWTGDTGLYIRTGMGALVRFGAPEEAYWPYDTRKYDVEPPPFVYAAGQSFKALKYLRLDPNNASPQVTLGNIKKYLAAGHPSAFGFPVYGIFEDTNGLEAVPLPRRGDRELGGHAIVACGYDDHKQALKIRNSWGESWGDKGYAWLSYEYVTQGLAVDFWTLLRNEHIDVSQFGE